MKNIAIFGSSRSGKSTLSKMLSKKYPNYHIIIGDDIRGAFKDALPQCEINSTGGKGMIDDFPRFLSALFHRCFKRNNDNFYYIVDSCDITPQKAKELLNNNTILLFLGTPSITAEEHFNEIRKYQTEKDWTFNRSDEELVEHCKHWIGKSIEFAEECKKLDIWFVDTSKNREEVLAKTLNKIENIIY